MTPPEYPGHCRQLLLPIFPADSIQVSDAVSVAVRGGFVWYFHQGMPISSHAVDDLASFRMQTSMLCDNGACKLAEVVRAFHVTSISVKRALKQYRAKGPRAFFGQPPPAKRRGPAVLNEQVRQDAQACLDAGMSLTDTAKRVQVKRDTLYRACKQGRLQWGQKKSPDGEFGERAQQP